MKKIILMFKKIKEFIRNFGFAFTVKYLSKKHSDEELTQLLLEESKKIISPVIEKFNRLDNRGGGIHLKRKKVTEYGSVGGRERLICLPK